VNHNRLLQDNDIAPDSGDLEKRVTYRAFAEANGYDAKALFTRVFTTDVDVLIAREDLWKKRAPPVSLDIDNLPPPPATAEYSSEGKLDTQRYGIPFPIFFFSDLALDLYVVCSLGPCPSGTLTGNARPHLSTKGRSIDRSIDSLSDGYIYWLVWYRHL
jgi:hypothetical protein